MATACGARESLLEQFCAVTGAHKDVAVRLLEACNNNLQLAIEMHMDGGEAQGDGPDQLASSSCPPDDTDRCEDDLDEVRAPIPQKRETLVEDGQMFAYRGRRRPAASVFDGFRDFQAETRQQEETLVSGGQSSTVSKAAKQQTLEDLFRPPIDITFKGTFTKARESGTSKKKWLLVNIQNVQEFQCQVLNRDVWSNHAVRGIIKQHFIFWQVYHDSEEGKKYLQFYQINTWPYVAIIDPITGENMISWNKLDVTTFCDVVSEFLAGHSSFDSSSDASSPPSKRLKKDSIVDASEEAQLEAAIHASMVETKKKTVFESSSDDDDDDDDSEVETFSDSDSDCEISKISDTKSQKSCEKSVNCDANNGTKNKTCEPSTSRDTSDGANCSHNDSADSSFSLTNNTDTEDSWTKYLGNKDDASTNLMVRFPDGNREQLSIPCSSRLMVLVKFAASKGFSQERFELVTNFPRRQLSYLDMEQTIEKAGLHPQETIFVQSRS